MSNKEGSKGMQTLQRSFSILECFTLEENELTLTEISRKVNLPKTTTSRMLETLTSLRMIRRVSNSSKYTLGYNLYVLGQIAGKSMEITQLARPILSELKDDCKESVALYMIDHHLKKRVCIERFISPRTLTINVTVGKTLDLHVGSGGKVLLAYQNIEFINEVIKNNILTEEKDEFMENLDRIRREKTNMSFDERGAGINSISSPIFFSNQHVEYCLAVSGPKTRFTEEVMQNIAKRVESDANKISNLLN